MITKPKPKKHKNRTPLIVLLTVVLISSILTAHVFTMNSNNLSSTDDTIYVKNEKELTNTINNVIEPITITLNKDIKLTKPLVIPNNKNITLTSNNKNNIKLYKLIGTNKQQPEETITINNNGVLHLADVIVTHTKNAGGRGIIVDFGGKLFMTGGEISGNNGRGVDGDDYCG
ncbi:MAG: hypothetical protein FWC30_06225, partial [Candidatus Bathyarchaeota archaeon]|nr:hypothetical protein [Candidatus Termiticorpusculum sp.]